MSFHEGKTFELPSMNGISAFTGDADNEFTSHASRSAFSSCRRSVVTRDLQPSPRQSKKIHPPPESDGRLAYKYSRNLILVPDLL